MKMIKILFLPNILTLGIAMLVLLPYSHADNQIPLDPIVKGEKITYDIKKFKLTVDES